MKRRKKKNQFRTIGGKTSKILTLVISTVIVITSSIVALGTDSLITKMMSKTAESNISVLQNSINDTKCDLAKNINIIKEYFSPFSTYDDTMINKTLEGAINKYDYDFGILSDEKGTCIGKINVTDINKIDNLGIIEQITSDNCITDIEYIDSLSLCLVSAAKIKLTNMDNCILILGKRLDKAELVDNLKNYNKAEYTLFYNKTAISTTMIKDKERQIGSLINEKIYNQIQNKGFFKGRNNILGKKYFSYYTGLINNDGKIVAIAFAGNDINDEIYYEYAFISIIILIIVIFGILAILSIVTTSKKLITKPLHQLGILIDKLNEGNLGISTGEIIKTNIESNDEIGILSNKIVQFINNLKKCISEITFVVQQISNGNLNLELTEIYKGDLNYIKEALLSIINNLNNTVKEISVSSKLVYSSSNQLATGAQTLSNSSIDQASKIEEISETIASVSDKINSNSNEANTANEITQNIKLELEHSSKKMNQMIIAMDEINNTSNQISKIIHTINSIAFQTNILALNAAVEAARAGNAGKGFAVVAEEVGNLAAKSSEAAKNIEFLINKSIEAVNKGTIMLNSTAEILNESVNSSKDTAEIVNRIDNIFIDQLNSINQINIAIEEISSVIQTNSATAQESAAASEELNNQASTLDSLVNKFKLKIEI